MLNRFSEHFAANALRSDLWGTTIGSVVYLALIPSLCQIGKPDLAVAAAGCAALCHWPFLLNRLGRRDLYLRARDHILVLHFLLHYAVGGQFARFIRLNQRLHHTSLPSFLLGFWLSSTLPWQAIDSLLIRMRARRFLLLKPLILLSVAPLDASLCQLACASMPDQAHFFGSATNLLRHLFSGLAPLAPSVLRADDASASCLKLQLFLQLLFSYALPAALLHKHEEEMLQKFAAEEDRRQAAASIVAGSSRAAAAAAAGGSEAPRALMPATVLALLMPAAALLPAVGMSALGASTTATAFVTVASIAAGLVTAHLPTAMWARSSGGPDSAAGAGGSTSAAWDATFRDAAYPWWLLPLVLSAVAWHVIDLLLPF